MQNFKQNQIFDKIFDRLPDHMALLLVVLSGFLLARLTWALFPEDPALLQAAKKDTVTTTEVATQQVAVKDVGQEIAKYHMLGVYKPPLQPAPKVVPAVVKKPAPVKKKRVPLQLVGVYSLPGNSGVAVITFQGKQDVFSVGQAIQSENGKESGAVLKAVYADSVEVDWGDGVETLKMPSSLSPSNTPIASTEAGEGGNDFVSTLPRPIQAALFGNVVVPASANDNANSGSVNAPTPAVNNRSTQQQQDLDSLLGTASSASATNAQNDQRLSGSLQASGNNNGQFDVDPAEAAKAGLGSFRQAVQQNNLNLLQVIRPSPRRENGRLIGFSIRPGTNAALFKQTGLQNGDIVTSINGTPLTSNSASRRAMRALSNSSSAVLNVLRDGQATTVQINF